MFNPIKFNQPFSFSGLMSCVCTVNQKIQSSTPPSQKNPVVLAMAALGTHRMKNLFLLFYSPLRLSIKPIWAAHLLSTRVISGLHGLSTSILSTRQTQSIIDYSDGFSNEYLLLLYFLKYSLMFVFQQI